MPQHQLPSMLRSPGAPRGVLSPWFWIVLVGGILSRPAVGDSGSRQVGGYAEVDAPHSSHPEGNDEQCWVFTHMPKSGGSTIKNILYRWWGQENTFLYNSDAWKLGEKQAATFVRGGKNWRLAVGGYSEVLRRHGAERCQWFTLFRHPVARVVSAYYFCRKKPQDQACASSVMRSEDVSLVTFARMWGNFAVRQFRLGKLNIDSIVSGAAASSADEQLPGWYMVKGLLIKAGNAKHPGHGEDAVLEDNMDRAKVLLRDGYAAIGILEEFNTTMRLFDSTLDMPGLNWNEGFSKHGVVNKNGMYTSIEEDVLETAGQDERIKHYLRFDIELYDYAVSLFQEQVSSAGLD